MKKSSEIILLAALLAFAFVVPNLHAADEAAPGPGAERRKELRGAAAEKLGLTAEQQASLKSIREQERAALEALKADASLTKEQKKEKLQAIRQDYQAQRQAVFTPEQKAKMQQFRDNHPNAGKARGDRPLRGKRGGGTGTGG